MIAAGNSGSAGLVPRVEERLRDDSPLVRGAAVWALAALDPARAKAIRGRGDTETDPQVREEWDDIDR
jgi:epoxyqueuosine reductase